VYDVNFKLDRSIFTVAQFLPSAQPEEKHLNSPPTEKEHPAAIVKALEDEAGYYKRVLATRNLCYKFPREHLEGPPD
jgi:hypothetical protein